MKRKKIEKMVTRFSPNDRGDLERDQIPLLFSEGFHPLKLSRLQP
jgi:hypothetical protein